ncbi:hypothetical protein AAFF_G00434270 [Aldrovandia affinis]|uniref:Uncharacterized protein n=1 Tax=Aldrovandia affinis TaxID=143900 RepID=A0AAD7WI72_9TELE|nr:hypothetical protein AAFF_G00434270 [Aldrovandia affinis]
MPILKSSTREFWNSAGFRRANLTKAEVAGNINAACRIVSCNGEDMAVVTRAFHPVPEQPSSQPCLGQQEVGHHPGRVAGVRVQELTGHHGQMALTGHRHTAHRVA